jgi:hypothetical protein
MAFVLYHLSHEEERTSEPGAGGSEGRKGDSRLLGVQEVVLLVGPEQARVLSLF